MTDKEKITDILKAYTKKHNISASSVILEEYAEELVKQGAIIPPCKVGQTVWYIKGGYYRKTGLEAVPIKVTEINKKWHSKILCWGFIANGTRYRFSSIGKTVFLTKEEAEAKLKELVNNAR